MTALRYPLLSLIYTFFLLTWVGCQTRPPSVDDTPNQLFQHPQSLQLPPFSLLDLTYPFNAQTIYWPTEDGFSLEKEFFGKTQKGYFYSANKFKAAEHGGTHVDAPIHFYKNGQSVDQIPLEQLFGEGIVLDVQNQVAEKRDYEVQVQDFLQWEKTHGRLVNGAIVLINTGRGRFYHDRQNYLGTSEKGPQAVLKLHFPGLHPDTALWLVKERKIKAIGIDTPSIDHGPSRFFQAHVNLCQHNIPIFENVANVDQLPSQGFWVMALPMKIENGSGAPLRMVAMLPQPQPQPQHQQGKEK